VVAAVVVPALPVAAGTPAPTSCIGRPLTQPALLAPGTLVGTSGNDVLFGSPGGDVIKGGGGNDAICGGPGSDRLEGGSGNDGIVGDQNDFGVNCPPGFGDDVLLGGAGTDALIDVCGNNTAKGGSSSDTMNVSGTTDGGSEDDAVHAYNGQFFCTGDEGCVTAHAIGGAGNDQSVMVQGGIAEGGSGADVVIAGRTGDELRGGSGADVLVDFSSSAVTMNGGSGRDQCNDSPDDTTISCEI